MKLYAIFANDKVSGTTHKLFDQAIQSFQRQGYDVDKLNLYDREKEIPFFRHDRAHMENNPFYMENQERFMQADALLMVFPLFWYSVPGILKTWLDMINGWAYRYESGVHAQPLHRIKKVFIIYASMQDKRYLHEDLHDPVEQQLTETCRFIGIPHVYTYIVDKVNTLKPDDLEQHLRKIELFCANKLDSI